jgi:hypothetical protein
MSDAHESTDQTDDYIVWQPVLRTVFTKEDITEIVVAIAAQTTSEPSSAAQTR